MCLFRGKVSTKQGLQLLAAVFMILLINDNNLLWHKITLITQYSPQNRGAFFGKNLGVNLFCSSSSRRELCVKVKRKQKIHQYERGIISLHYLGEHLSEVRRRFTNYFGSTLSLLIHQKSLYTYLEDENNKKKACQCSRWGCFDEETVF